MIKRRGLIRSAARAIKKELLQKPLFVKFIGKVKSRNKNSPNMGLKATAGLGGI
jgi:hypothetical protein